MPPSDRLPITGDAVLDGRIWEIAIDRGYLLRPVAGPDLGSADGVPMQPQAAAAWLELKKAARAAGHPVRLLRLSVARQPVSPVQLQAEGHHRRGNRRRPEVVLDPGDVEAPQRICPRLPICRRDVRRVQGHARLRLAGGGQLPQRQAVRVHPLLPRRRHCPGPNPEPWEFVWVGVDVIECGCPVSTP